MKYKLTIFRERGYSMDDEYGQHVHYDLTDTADIEAALADADRRKAEVVDLRERSSAQIR